MDNLCFETFLSCIRHAHARLRRVDEIFPTLLYIFVLSRSLGYKLNDLDVPTVSFGRWIDCQVSWSLLVSLMNVYCLRHTTVDNYLVAICIKSCRGSKVDDCSSDLLGPWHWILGLISKYWRFSHFPALPIGIGTTGFAILLTISVPSIVA